MAATTNESITAGPAPGRPNTKGGCVMHDWKKVRTGGFQMDSMAWACSPAAAGPSAVKDPCRKHFFRSQNRERPPLTRCENCGTQLSGKYCSVCGQPAIDYRRSFRHVIVDVLDSFLNWDSKFFATIGLLIARPWRLTNEFLAGKRVRYVHPARLYLLASILFFFAVTYWVKSAHLHPKTLTPGARAEIEVELDKEKLTPEQRANVANALKILPPETTGHLQRAIKPKETPTETPKTENATDKELEE